MANSTAPEKSPPTRSTLGRDDRGTSSTEFTVLVAIITVICLTGWQYMGRAVVRILVGD